ncbi:MAG: inositol monophosphatase [Desulfuromonadales bacterium]|nr:inositol monophosphatase [Desulfuromonadales bacterium]
MSIWNTHLHVAIEAAQRAGSFQRYRFMSPLTINLKGDKDLVTEVDRESERLIVDHLLTHFADHTILAEENHYPQSASPLRWIIDPLDGTTNYAHSFPWFCVSIALEADGELVVAVIFNPITDELFTATRGGGAFLNGRTLHVTAQASLSNSLLGTGFPYDCATDPANNFDNFIAFQKAARGIRRAGAAALDLAAVSAGRLDGFWELKLKPWDVAAGVLLVNEAGGRVTGFDGAAYSIFNDRIVASNGLIHGEMTAKLGAVSRGKLP